MKKVGIAVAVALVAAVMLVLLAHTPLVRGAALRYAIGVVQRNYGLTLEAERLDYNLVTLRVGLAGLRVSAEGSQSEPFFQADYVAVWLPSRILLGVVSFRDISVTNGRVFVHRRADGSANLPESEDSPTGDPPPLRVDRIDVPNLAVEVQDEQADLALNIPAIGFVLTPDEGSIASGAAAEIRIGARTIQVAQLRGQATFDGRALKLTATELRTGEVSMLLDGSIVLIARESSLDLNAQGTGDLARIARLASPDVELPSGQVTFRATVSGPMGEPDVALDVASDRAAWRNFVVTDLSGRALVSSETATVESLAFALAGGTVTAIAVVPFDAEADATVKGMWRGIDMAVASRAAAPEAQLVPSAAAAGQIDVRGRLSDTSTWSGEARLALAAGRNARGRIALGGDLRLALRPGMWHLEGQPRVAEAVPLRIIADGDLGASEDQLLGHVAGMVDVDQTDLTTLLSALRTTGVADVPADAVSSGAFEANFDLGGTLMSPTLEGHVSARDVAGSQFSIASLTAAVNGQPVDRQLDVRLEAPAVVAAGQSLSDVRGVAAMNGDSIDITEISVRQSDGTGVVTGSGTYAIESARYTARIAGTDWALVPTAEQPIAGRVNLRFEGSGSVDQPGGSGEIAVSDAMWQDMALGAVDASVTLEGRSARIEAHAPDFDATANGRVALDAPYAASVSVNAGRLELARVLQGIETPTPVTGTTEVALTFEGPLETWRTGSAAVEVSSFDATAGQLPLRLAGPARLRYGNERVTIESLELDVGETRLSAAGELDAFEPSRATAGVLVTLTGEIGEVARAAAATGLAEVPVEGGNGPVALLARVNGSFESPLIAADLEVGPGSVALQDLPTVSQIVLRAHAENGWFELREGVASYQDANISANGRVPISWVAPSVSAVDGDAVVHAQATNLTASILSPFLEADTVSQLEGAVDATLDAQSPRAELNALTGELRIDRLDVRVAELPVTQRVPTRIVARDGFARIEAWEWMGQGATLNVRGQVRLEDRQAAILANGSVDLRTLTPFVRDAGLATAGRLEPRLSITGTLDDPRVDGDMTLTAGELRLADPRMIVSELEMRTVVSRTTARITSLTGTANGGALTGSGQVEYRPDEGLNLQLSASIDGMALEFPQGLRSEVNADLDLALKGAPEPGGLVSGTVTVVRGSYREPLAVVAGVLSGMRTRRIAASTPIDSPSPLLDALALDIDLLTDEDIVVNNNYGRFQLGADLRIVGTASAPSVTGRADLREGGRLFVGRNVYAITFGTIDFTNPVTIEPTLNISATTRVGGAEIEVTLRGPAENPTPELSSPSNPELTQADLVSLLLTGRPYDELAPDDAAFVGTQVVGNLSGEVLGFAGRAIGLDTIRLGGPETRTLREDPMAAATEIDPTSRLTFGKALGPDVDLTFSQSLRDGDAQTWILDYLPLRGLELRLVSNDEDLRSYGFRHDVAFGGPPRLQQTARATQVQRVVRVDLSGDLGVAEERVRGELRLEPGDRFDFVEWQEDRDRLEALYREAGYLTARITAGRSEAPEGVALEYQITAGPATRIVVRGMEISAAVRGRLETAWAQSAFDEFLRDEVTEIIRSELAREQYLEPMVQVAFLEEGTARTLSIDVERGSRTSRTVVRVDGVDEALTAAIMDTLEEQGLVAQAVSNPAAVAQATADYLRRQGYLRAQVTPGAPLFGDATAIVPVTIDAGPVFSIARIAFEGAERLSEAVRLEAVALMEGAPYDALVVDEARNRLVALYRREAFPSATVTVRPDVPADATNVSVTFVVKEGPQQVFGEVVVTGNRGIDTDVIVRALELDTGAPLRPEDLIQARTRVLDLGLFRRVDVVSEQLTQSAAGPDLPVRLTVTVEEWPAVRLRYGVEIAERRPEDSVEGRDLTPGLSADLTRRTLFGRAITIGGAFEWQRRERVTRAFASTGTLFGLPIGSSIIGERSRIDSATAMLVTEISSITWEQRFRLRRNLNLSYAYTFERNHTFSTRAPLPGDPVGPLDITINIARLTAAAAWDTRDDPVDTAQGSFFSLSLENAPESVGSDIRFLRELVQAYHFRPWRGAVFASAARVGIVTPLGGQDVIPSERFFTGGARTVRGAAEDSLGPLDFFFHQPEGGRFLMVLNQEVRVPLYRWLRGVGFIDAGNVFERPRDASLRDLVGSVGFGLRLATPFALLRVDFARPVWNTPTGSSGRWIFGIGQAF